MESVTTELWNPRRRCRDRPSVRASTVSCHAVSVFGRVVVEALGPTKDGVGAGLRGAHAVGVLRRQRLSACVREEAESYGPGPAWTETTTVSDT